MMPQGVEHNPIDARFRTLQAQGRKAFIPFVPAGDPDLDTTGELVRELVRRGCSLIEVGFPYSDPIADGSVIQAAYTRALQHGLRMDDIFDCVRQLATSQALREAGVPLVAMVSYSLVHRRGAARFVEQAQAAGLNGAIVPDLPLEEAEPLVNLARARNFKLIQLVTPTTPRERAARIAQASSGFLYCVSVTGITGERERLPEELLEQLAWLRTQTDLPLCVGFGISKPEHVRMLKPAADGVIVGSAIVRQLEQAAGRPRSEVIAGIGRYVQTLIEALEATD
jgi:tryptophan synthase alpha chain